MREWRQTHKLVGEARIRDIVRHYAAVYVRRGVITKTPCILCRSAEKVEMHHEDYSKPLQVLWICRPHNVALTMGRLSLWPEHAPKVVTMASTKAA